MTTIRYQPSRSGDPEPRKQGGPLTPAEFGAALPSLCGRSAVSRQMVGRWIAEGLPATRVPSMGRAKGGDRRGSWVISDVEAAAAWVRSRPRSGVGGKRLSLKRQSDKPAEAKPKRPAPYTRPPPDSVAASAPARVFDAERALAEIEGREPDAIDYSVAGLQRLSPERCLQLKIIEDILFKRTERLKLEGGLIDAQEARRAWIRVLEAARRTFADVGRLSVLRIAGCVAMNDQQRAKVRSIIDEQVDDGLLRMTSPTESGR